MSRTAPKNAPKSAPKISEPVEGWQSHWLSTYHKPRLVLYRGKWGVAVTKPKGLQKPTDPDKKLSAKTTDKAIAEQRKWEIAAKIYAGFDAELANVDPQIAKDNAFREIAFNLFKQHGIKDPKITNGLKSAFFEADDIVRMGHKLGITFPDDIISLLSDEAKYFLTHLPLLVEETDAEREAEQLWGKKNFDFGNAIDELASGLDYLKQNPDMPDVGHSKMVLKYLALEIAKHDPDSFTDADKQLANHLLSGAETKLSSAISDVSKRYLDEYKWNRNRTKSGTKLAIERFCALHGETTDINEFNAKHAYAFAKWMEEELGSANKSIKGAISYVKGMFSWAITQPEYTISEEPWSKLSKIRDYGKKEESYRPFRKKQLLDLFSLINIKGSGRMNRREHLMFSILITTGCRLDEAALLCWDNIIEHSEGWNYIDLRRALVKNQGSKRLLPIPNCLWPLFPPKGHQLTVSGICKSTDDRLFDYSIDDDGKAARASSQACGRQLNKIDKEPSQVTHSLRGNLKDLLRNAGVSKELNDYITGHGQGDVGGDRYGDGHEVELRYQALNKVDHPWIQHYPE